MKKGDYDYSATKKWSASFPDDSALKNPHAKAGNLGSVPGLGRSTGGGNGNPFQYSCLKNFIDRKAWQSIVLGISKRWTQLAIKPPPQHKTPTNNEKEEFSFGG